MSEQQTIYSIDFGVTGFGPMWDIQSKINNFKQNNKSSDLLIFTEHQKVYTLGRGGDRNHLLISKDEMKENNVQYFEIDRGGDLTYHGPGQLLCYPIFDLTNYYLDTHRYLRDLEEIIIRTLNDFGITGTKDEQYTGVWVNNEKICSIGIKVSRWITMHGLALNVNNELDYFEKIIPCGIFHRAMTSMKKILQKEIPMPDVKTKIKKHFEEVFHVTAENIAPPALKVHFPNL